MSEIIKSYQDIAQKIGKYYHYKNANLSFTKTNTGEVNENVVLITLENPEKKEYPNKISAAFLNTENGLKVINYFMSKYYLFDAAEEERERFPENYKIYQDDVFAYITSEMPTDIALIAKLFKTLTSFESIFLSKKTHYKYEKLSEYIEFYECTRDAIKACIENQEDKEIIEHLRKDHSYQKQIVEPLANACVSLLGKTNYSYTSKTISEGEFVVLRISSPNELEEIGICLLISESNDQVVVKKATGRNPDGTYNTIDLPDKVVDLLGYLQTKPKTSAAKA